MLWTFVGSDNVAEFIELYLFLLLAFIIFSFVDIIIGNERLIDDVEKYNNSIEELKEIINRTFGESFNKLIDIIDNTITKIRRK